MTGSSLERLARLLGVLPAYRDGFRQDRRPSNEALCAALAALGAEVATPADVDEALRAARSARWTRLAEPVVASWVGPPVEIGIRLPETGADNLVQATLVEEGGGIREWSMPVASLRVARFVTLGSRRYAALRFPVARALPVGYHRLRLRAGVLESETLLIRAPRKCPKLARTWGVFLPLHALHSRRSPAVGTFRDLGALIDWVQDLGGGLVGTLPLLAAFLDEPYAPSPYTPASRLFWNEFYLDLHQVPEWSAEMGGIQEASGGRHVDFRQQMRSKRAALEQAAGRLEASRRAQFQDYLEATPELRAYSSFRAGLERGNVGGLAFDADNPACRYHAYAQWQADSQIRQLSQAASRRGPGLYLDLPLGTHPQGFDCFRFPESFARDAAGGAPPDRFFSKGQNWGFAPIHPWRAREAGHEYFIASVRHHLRHAGVLRIDHLMGLHRMYWIPEGFDGDQGTYVRYPAEELYAIVCLEATRHRTAVVGEDLGTVPGYVRQCMAEHGLRRTYVAQFEFRGEQEAPLPTPPAGAVASVNTHDTATFSTFWSGADIDDQVALGLLDEPHAVEARERRGGLREALLAYFGSGPDSHEPGDRALAVLRSCLEGLSESDADCVMVTLEDLWGEPEPQNTPGTDLERPNWTRRARLGFEEFQRHPEVLEVLRNVNRRRSRRRERPANG